jgi:ABC-type transport system involved in multi-copper enzyme maturation permease subunit
MLAAVRSELTRLGQPRLLATWFGLTALFAAMVNMVMVTFVAGGGSLPPGAPGVAFPSLAEMESPSGLMAGLSAASNMFGIVTLSLWAVATATDYSSGLIRLLVAAEPRRWRLVAGKVVALVVVTAAATTIAAIVNVVAVMPAAQAAGIATAAWGTDLVEVVATAWLNLFLSLCVWGVLGLAIAVLARSAAVALAIGVGYVLVVESLIKMVGDAPSDWLLGTTLNAVASGGTETVAYGTALALALGYVTLGLAFAGTVFVRRDVTD